jgi:cytochrome b
VFHALLALGVGAAWLTGDEAPAIGWHTAAGYGVAALIAFRLAWGFVGGRWSRWSAFPLLRRAEGPGHSTTAAWSALAAIAIVAGLVVTGVIVLGGEELRGPMAGLPDPSHAVVMHSVHSALAWAILGWLGVHLAGVAKQSLAERQNLARGMVDGKKRTSEPGVPARAGVAALLAASAVGLVGWTGTRELPEVGNPLPADPIYDEACGECHLAFPPRLLPAASWERTLDEAGDHFDEDLALDPDVSAHLRAWLVANAAETRIDEHAVRAAPIEGAPLRITETSPWKTAHQGIPDAVWENPDVKSRVRCKSCHPDAAEGRFDGAFAAIPSPEDR